MLSLALGALVISALQSDPAQASSLPCPPSVVLDGPPPLTDPVASTLRSHGVLVGTPASCVGRAVRASLAATEQPDAGSLRLHVEDADGRTSDRVVESPTLAASLIESWTVDENADLLTRADSAKAVPVLAVAPPPTPVRADTFIFTTALESASATDGSVWWGGEIGACGSVGRVCIGGRVGLWRDWAVAGPAIGGTSRFATDAVLTAAASLRQGRFVLTPSLGFGVGWSRTAVPADDGGETLVDAIGPRADASLAIGGALTRWFAAAFVLGALWAPAHAGAQELDAGGTFPGEPAVVFHAGLGGVWRR